jgi:hypothetical protein
LVRIQEAGHEFVVEIDFSPVGPGGALAAGVRQRDPRVQIGTSPQFLEGVRGICAVVKRVGGAEGGKIRVPSLNLAGADAERMSDLVGDNLVEGVVAEVGLVDLDDAHRDRCEIPLRVRSGHAGLGPCERSVLAIDVSLLHEQQKIIDVRLIDHAVRRDLRVGDRDGREVFRDCVRPRR